MKDFERINRPPHLVILKSALYRKPESLGNLTLVYTRSKNIVRSKVFKRKNTEIPEILTQRAKIRVLGRFGRREQPSITTTCRTRLVVPKRKGCLTASFSHYI